MREMQLLLAAIGGKFEKLDSFVAWDSLWLVTDIYIAAGHPLAKIAQAQLLWQGS
tara:strand:- start:269 stop:433 length:165 start_codon:yes stop_codon:yes gene_type:complete